MSVADLRAEQFAEVVAGAAVDVLETMFFTSVLDPAECEEPECNELLANDVETSVCFGGDRAGSLSIRIREASARLIAADFLGVDDAELSGGQVSAVMCELTNMICGAALSRLDLSGDFLLAAPQAGPADSGDQAGLELVLRLEEGPLRVRLHLGDYLANGEGADGV